MSIPLIIFLISGFLVSLLLTFVGMPVLLRLCQQRGIYDIPNERKIHHNKIPRMGGVFFAPAMIVGVAVSFLLMLAVGEQLPQFGLPTFFISAGLFLIYIIGLFDDMLGLSAKVKFLVQIVTSLFFPLCGVCINNLYGLFGVYELPLWAGYLLTVFISVVIINAINLIDGIDGLAGSIVFIALGGFAWEFIHIGVFSYALMAASLMGTVLAFLYYNLFGRVERNTKTFMGDTGSLILGYALAFLGIKYAMNMHDVVPYRPNALLISYSLLLLPTFDAGRVAVSRLYRGVSMFHADKTHIHHKFLAAGLSMRWALVAVVGMQVMFIVLNFFISEMCLRGEWMILTDLLIYAAVIWLLNYFKVES